MFRSIWPARRGPTLLPQPQTPLLLVGDVHGCRDLLERLLERLQADPDVPGPPARLIFTGDLVDRGPDSRGVIDRVRLCQTEGPWPTECLMGNHEAMLLEFLDGVPFAREDDDPRPVPTAEALAARWLGNGGWETLASFGVSAPPDLADLPPSDDAWQALQDEAAAAIGPERIAWLRARPLWLQSGDVIAVHAAWDRDAGAEAQSVSTLIWGLKGFTRARHAAPPWVVHGHIITRPPTVAGTRIAIDSGAFLSGALTCAVLLPDTAPRLITLGLGAS